MFANRCVYIGQTVDLKAREGQHRSPSTGWHTPFEFRPLSCVMGTQADAVHHEVAWRLLAWRRGWDVYARPPGVRIRRHGALITPEAHRALRQMTWPLPDLRPWWRRLLAL